MGRSTIQDSGPGSQVQSALQDDIDLCSEYTPAPHLSRSNRDSKAVTAPKCMIILVIVSRAESYVALENPKKRISIQETVIHPELWSFLRWLLVSFGAGPLLNRRSFPRKRESSRLTVDSRRFAEWIPAFAGTTAASSAHVLQMRSQKNLKSSALLRWSRVESGKSKRAIPQKRAQQPVQSLAVRIQKGEVNRASGLFIAGACMLSLPVPLDSQTAFRRHHLLRAQTKCQGQNDGALSRRQRAEKQRLGTGG